MTLPYHQLYQVKVIIAWMWITASNTISPRYVHPISMKIIFPDDELFSHGQNQTSVTFPVNSFFTTDHDHCKFQSDCTYNITARALNGKTTLSTSYHIKGKRITHEIWKQHQSYLNKNLNTRGAVCFHRSVIALKWNFIYTECVNGMCLCRNADKLPQASIYPKMLSDKELYFKWEVDDSNYSSTRPDAALQYLTIE